MKDFFNHARSYIFRGLLAITPLLLSILAIKLLYELIDKKVMGFVDQFVQVRQIPGLGILLVLICLYFIGLIVSNIIGRQLFAMLGYITERIPIIKVIYQIGKQLSDSLSSASESQKAFKKAILVDCNNSGLWTVAFVVGSIKGKDNEEWWNVFVPNTPTPTSGFLFLVKPSNTRDPGWSVEEALKMAFSVGIISPAAFKNPEPES